MDSKKLLRNSSLALGLSISLATPASHADLVAIGLGIITAPITIPMGLIDSIRQKRATKKEEERIAKMNQKAQEYSRAQLQDLAKFVEKGCPADDLLSPEADKIRYFTDLKLTIFPDGEERDIRYYSKDSNGIGLGPGDKVRETFGQIDDIPSQEARKFTVKKLKEILVRYTNSKEKLMKMYHAKDLAQFSKEQRQLLANFTCDQAQARLSEKVFYDHALARSLALLEREKQGQQSSTRVENRKSENDFYGVN